VPSPKLVPLNLADDERRTLEAWSRRRKTAQALAERSRIVLACAAGGSNSAVAADLGVSRDMVSKWRSRFAEKRLAGLTSADEILENLAACCSRITHSGHW
jgi:FixJ family two-component response regulator